MGEWNRREGGVTEKSVFFAGHEFLEDCGGALLFFEHLNLQLGILEPAFADLEQSGAFLEFREQVGQRHIARFHRFDDGLEFAEGGFKGKFGVNGVHGDGPCVAAGVFQTIFGLTIPVMARSEATGQSI